MNDETAKIQRKDFFKCFVRTSNTDIPGNILCQSWLKILQCGWTRIDLRAGVFIHDFKKLSRISARTAVFRTRN